MAKTKWADSHDYWHFLELMKPYLQRGFSIHKTCKKLELPYDAILAKANRDEKYLQKIEVLQEYPELLARTTWVKKIEEGDYIAARDYLRSHFKDEFSEKKEENLTWEIRTYQVVDDTK